MRVCIQCLDMRYRIVKLLNQQASKSFQVKLSDHKISQQQIPFPNLKKIDYSVTKTLHLEQIVLRPNYNWTSVGNPHPHVTWTKVQDWSECISHLTFLL